MCHVACINIPYVLDGVFDNIAAKVARDNAKMSDDEWEISEVREARICPLPFNECEYCASFGLKTLQFRVGFKD